MKKSDFEIAPAETERFEEYLQLMIDHFITREQMSIGLEITPEIYTENLRLQISTWLSCGACVHAIYIPTGELAGLSLTNIMTRDNRTTFVDDRLHERHKNVQNFYRFLEYMENSVDLFSDPTVNKVLEIATTTVKPKFAGMGLTVTMTQQLEKIGKSKGCQLATSQSTSLITQYIRPKMGYEEVFRIYYDDFEVDKEKVFKVSKMDSKYAVVLKKYL